MALNARLQPDAYLHLGDQLDEGSFASPPQWDAYVARYQALFSTTSQTPAAAAAAALPAQLVRVVGNHDTEFGHRLRHMHVARYEASFNASNQRVMLHASGDAAATQAEVVTINSLALTSPLEHLRRPVREYAPHCGHYCLPWDNTISRAHVPAGSYRRFRQRNRQP